MTLEGTPNIVSPSGVAGFDFLDEADTVNALIPKIKKRASTRSSSSSTRAARRPRSTSTAAPGVTGADRRHRRAPRRRGRPDRLGPHAPALQLRLRRQARDERASRSGASSPTSTCGSTSAKQEVTSIAINNKIVTRDVAPDRGHHRADLEVQRARGADREPADRAHHRATSCARTTTRSSSRWATSSRTRSSPRPTTAGFGDAVSRFMNPGGVRADLIYAGSPAGEGDGVVTYGELFTVQPFGNSLVTMTLTGAQIDRMLEQQFCGLNSPDNTPTPGSSRCCCRRRASTTRGTVRGGQGRLRRAERGRPGDDHDQRRADRTSRAPTASR